MIGIYRYAAQAAHRAPRRPRAGVACNMDYPYTLRHGSASTRSARISEVRRRWHHFVRRKLPGIKSARGPEGNRARNPIFPLPPAPQQDCLGSNS